MIPGLTIEEEVLELESQIRHLNAKVAAAVDRAADLEDEIRKYKQRERAQAAAAVSATGGEEGAMEPASALKRMSTFMFSNKRASNALSDASAATPASPRKVAADEHLPLALQLAKERQARQHAEENYAQLQQESEELSQTLFEEANKMVAQERKLTHQVTEKLKMLADREEERTARLRHLEGAMERILRIRGLLAASPTTTRSPEASASATSRSPVATPVKSPATVVAAAQAQHAARYAQRAQPRSPGSSKPTSPAAALASGAAQLPVFSPSKITLAREAARIQVAANAQRVSPPPTAGATVAPQTVQTTVPVPRIKTNTSMQQAREAATASAAQVEQQQQQRREQLAARASPPAKIKLQPRPAATWTQSNRPLRPTTGTAGALTANSVERRPIVRRPVAEVGEAGA